MAAFPCPYCGHELASGDDVKLERCSSCDGTLLIAYRYRLISAHGKIAGGELYQAMDDGFGERVAVLFVEKPQDRAAVDCFLDGARLFADLGGRGLVKIYDIGTPSDRRPYVVMDWLEGGTLDAVVQRRGALDQATLLELVGDLLTGVSKAHRAMPAIVHGHIHAGKIGFRREDQVVLFGFEWATQVNAQASHLADSFISGDAVDERRQPASDLRQLAVVFYYAATGDWIGELDLASQREHVRAQVPGPLGRLIDRMLGAGVDGYRNAVQAAIDFEQLMRGIDTWQAPSPVRKDQSSDRMGTAWAAHASDEDEDEDEDEEEEEEDEDIEQYMGSAFAAVKPAPTPASRPATPNWAALNAQRQAQAQARAQPPTKSPGKAVVMSAVFMIVIGTCVAGILADANEDPAPPPALRQAPPVQVEPIPQVYEPPPPIAEPQPEYEPPPSLPGVFRYQGEITGPESFAGLALGQRCDVFIQPNAGTLNCRWYIDCGTPRRRIYGGGDVGFSSCELTDEGHPLRAQDEDDDAPDGAFLADFTTEPPMIIVEDRWIEPPVRVIISIEDGDLFTGPIPETKHAPRDSQDEVQARILAGESPVIEAGVLGKW